MISRRVSTYNLPFSPSYIRLTRESDFSLQVLPTVNSEPPLRPARNPPKMSVYDFLPFLRIFKPIVDKIRGVTDDYDGRRSILGNKKYIAYVESNVPLEITLYLSSYLAWLLKKGLLTPALATAVTNNIASLQECGVSLARIRNTVRGNSIPHPLIRSSLSVYSPFRSHTRLTFA